VDADHVICACDTDFTFRSLLSEEYMPKALKKQYEARGKYPVSSGFQIAYGVEGVFPELTGTRVFSCTPIRVGSRTVDAMSVQSYDYEPGFAPEGKTVLQTNFSQTEEDYIWWQETYQDKERYEQAKQEMAQEALERLVVEYPCLEGKIRILDIWTPMTYTRYCNAYKGAYMSFVNTKNAKSVTVPGTIKGLKNVYLASQWLMGPGGLPTAAAMGKFAAWRIIQKG
jgi:phytoene dehydrogenase-like protein